MPTYHWYCPECGKEDYEDEEEPKTKSPKVCHECGAELCRLEPEGDDSEMKAEADD